MEYQYTNDEIDKAADVFWGSVLELPETVMKNEKKRELARFFKRFSIQLQIKRQMAIDKENGPVETQAVASDPAFDEMKAITDKMMADALG